jgi:tape measure domain-containing protein
MAKLGDLVVRIGADTRDLNKSLGRVQRNLRSMTSNIQRMGQDMTRSLSLPLAAVGAAALKSAANLETLETSFVSLTGGVEQAGKMMQQLTAFTAKTPFQLDAVAKSARQLIASGTDISQVNDQLQFLGDIAATSGSSIDEIAAIFAKVNAKGKVELENLNQLAERGIPIFTALSEATGLPADKLGAGAVSVEQFSQVLQGFAQEGGFAEGAMLRLSQTVSGKFSTALDNAKLAAASLGEQLLPFASKALDAFTNLAQKFTELDDSTKRIGIAIAAFAASLGPAILGITGVVKAITLLASPIGVTVLAIGALTAAFIYFYDEIRPIITAATNLMIELYNNVLPLRVLISIVQTAFVNAGKAIVTAFTAVGDTFKTIFNALTKALQGDLPGAFNALKDGLGNVAADVVEVASDIGADLVQGINKAIYAEKIDLLGEDALPTKAEIMERFNGLFEGTGEVIATEVSSGLDAVKTTVAQVKPIVETTTAAFKNMGEVLADSIGNAVGQAATFKEAMLESARAVIIAYLAQTKAKILQNSAEGAAGTGPAFPFVMAGLLTAGMALVNRVGIPALAQGGLAYGPTMAMVGDNRNAAIDPEVVAPLSKLKDMMGGGVVEVVGRIKGDDIFLSNARSNSARNRYA